MYLDKDVYLKLRTWLRSSDCITLEEVPVVLKSVIMELISCRILVQSDDEDDKVLKFIRSRIPSPSISVCYLILSEQCNLACRYCFLGNNNNEKRKSFLSENMSVEVADSAIDFFLHQLSLSEYSEIRNPAVIFYGGEPLVNFDILVHIATRLNQLSKSNVHLKNLEMGKKYLK